MNNIEVKKHLWILYGFLSIIVIFGTAMLYDFVGPLSTQLHTPIQLATPIDLSIPLIPSFIIIYWFIFYSFIFFSYLYFAFVDREYRNGLVVAFVLVNLIAYAIYLILPVLGPDRLVTGTDFFSSLIQALYTHDTQVNCFPSLHGSTSLLTAYALWKAKKEYGYISWPIAIAVVISTLFVRQHWIADQIAAALITLPVAYIIFNKFKYTRVTESTTVIHRWQLILCASVAVIAMVVYLWALYLT